MDQRLRACITRKAYGLIFLDLRHSLQGGSRSLTLSVACMQGLSIDDRSAKLMKITGDELVEEKQLALECLSEAA